MSASNRLVNPNLTSGGHIMPILHFFMENHPTSKVRKIASKISYIINGPIMPPAGRIGFKKLVGQIRVKHKTSHYLTGIAESIRFSIVQGRHLPN